jgi:Holliday junction DNA helicase RuvB
LEEVYEPFLIQEGFLMRTPRGREATGRAFRRFGYAPGAAEGEPQSSLFDE